MYFFTPPSTLYFILKTHLQVIGFLSLGNSVSVQVFYFVKTLIQNLYLFSNAKIHHCPRLLIWMGVLVCVLMQQKALGCVFCLKNLLTFLLFIIYISLVGACIFLCDLTCVISLKESSCVGLFIIISLMWLSFQMVEVGSKINEDEFEVCAPFFC
jgi:hypothetical protein